MSWIDDINKQFVIQTGDKVKYYPLLLQNYNKTNEYNGQKFELVSKSGSTFIRQLPKGRSFDLTFAFTGENNKKIGASFDQSARDRRSWTVTHPFYGTITVQPISLKFDDSPLDSCIITCTVVETTKEVKQKITQQAIDELNKKRDEAMAAIVAASATNDVTATNDDLCVQSTVEMSKFVKALLATANAIKKLNQYKNYALNQINNAYGAVVAFQAAVQRIIHMPADIANSIGNKINTLKDMFTSLKDNLSNIASPDYFTRLFNTALGGNIITAQASCLTNENTTGLETKEQVFKQLNDLIQSYNDYVEFVYSLENEEFIPDIKMMMLIETYIYETTMLLYEVLNNAKTEMTYVTGQKTNVILLSHRLLGEASESNINEICTTNNIGLNEVFEIKQGRSITYYV